MGSLVTVLEDNTRISPARVPGHGVKPYLRHPPILGRLGGIAVAASSADMMVS